VSNVAVILNEGTLVEEELDSLSGGQLVVGVLFVDSPLATGLEDFGVDLLPSLLEGFSGSGAEHSGGVEESLGLQEAS